MSSNLALVIGGSGSVGSLFCELLLKRYQKVVVVDLVENRQLKKMGVDFTRGDIGHLSEIDLINDAELVLVTTPEEPAIHAIDSLVSLLHPGQCLIDTLSVKSPISKSLRRLGSGVEAISINPMFGPSLGFNGQSVAAVDYCSGPISNSFLGALQSAGAEVVYLSAEQHDQYTAAIQAATHAAIISFGLALKNMNYDSEIAKGIWTPPHRLMLSLLARVLSADPEVYRDIQTSNPFAEDAREALSRAVQELSRNIETSDPKHFEELFNSLKPITERSRPELIDLFKSATKQQ